jgi:hypothetical protein
MFALKFAVKGALKFAVKFAVKGALKLNNREATLMAKHAGFRRVVFI